MIEKLLLFREQLRSLYGRYSMVIRPLGRFAAMLGALYTMSTALRFGKYLSLPVCLAASAVGAWLPVGVDLLIAALIGLVNLYGLSVEVTAAVAGMMAVMFCLNSVIRPETGILVLLMPFFHLIGIPYAPVLAAGLLGSLTQLLPATFGTLLYYGFVYIGSNASVFSSSGLEDAANNFAQLLSGLGSNREMWLMCAGLGVMLTVTWGIGRLKIDYARRIALGGGLASGFLTMLIGIFALNVRTSVPAMIAGFAVSGLLAFGLEFMRLPLNYLGTEYAQFEDDEYYYYVKAVPKMAISRPDKQVKRLNVRKELENTATIPDVVQADTSEKEDR